MDEITPGIYPGIPYKEYAAWPALSRSVLMEMKRSAAHLKHLAENGRKETEAMRVGSAIHTLVLEPDAFNDRYIPGIEGDGRKKEVKEARQALKEAAGDRCILDPQEHRTVFEVAQAVRTHPRALEYVNAAQVEISLVWKDEATGVLCKARLDGVVHDQALILDLKTTDDASPESFARSILNYHYHNQAAFYRSGMAAFGFEVRHLLLIAAETEPPHGVALYRLADGVLDLAERENANLLRRYRTCVEKGAFPGYPEKVTDIGIPAYGLIKLEETYGPVAY